MCGTGTGLQYYSKWRLSEYSKSMTYATKCVTCTVGFTRMMFKDLTNTVNFFCVRCNSNHSTAPQDAKFVVSVEKGPLINNLKPYNVGPVREVDKFACPCGVGKITDKSGTCPPSPANTYQPVEGALTAINCPENSESAAGSASLDA